jgi:cysteine desulfurase/selenocysteine lyase
MAFDVEAVRAEFPILRRQGDGKPLVYLALGRFGAEAARVIEAMTHSMEHLVRHVHRGLPPRSPTKPPTPTRRPGARWRRSSTPTVNEIVFTKGGTEAVNLVAAGLGARLAAGDEIIVSQMEHHANIVPWHFLRERLGVVLKWVPVTDDGSLDLAAFQDLLGPKTKVVALSHMSNVLGTINDAKSWRGWRTRPARWCCSTAARPSSTRPST